MRIVLAPDGTRGDVNPMLLLGERLVADGHSVVMCGPAGFCDEALALGLEFVALPFDVEAWSADNAEAMTLGGRQALAKLNEMWMRSLESQFERMPEVVRDADVVVSAGAQFSGPSMAEKFRARHVAVGYVPTLLPSALHPPIMIAYRKLPRWVNRCAWWTARRYYHHLMGRPLNVQRERIGLKPVPDVYAAMLGGRFMLACDAELAPAPPDATVAVAQVGALQREEHVPLSTELEAFIEDGSKPIYLGFGSMRDAAPDDTTALIVEAAHNAGVRVVLAAGWAGLGGGLCSGDVFVVEHAPHHSLLPRLAGAVHHGGAGTTAAAAHAGVAQLIVPHLLDQHYFGRRAADAGIGAEPIGRDALTAPRLAKGLRELAMNDAMARRAADLGEKLRAADQIGDAARFVAAEM